MLPAKGVVNRADGPKYQTIGRIDSLRKVGDKESDLERRYYIRSRDWNAEQLAAAIRAHRGIENRLHGVFDLSVGEDGRTIGKDNAPQNLSLPKKSVLNLIGIDTTDKTQARLRLKRKGAVWDDEVRMSLLGLTWL